MYKSSGIIKYNYIDGYGHRMVVETDPELSRYYFSLLPKYLHIKSQGWKPHISLIRNEIPAYPARIFAYIDQRVSFLYDPYIFNDEQYYWINCYSKELEAIREDVGLPYIGKFWKPPLYYLRSFHITIGNIK
jgi:hypothetical protein